MAVEAMVALQHHEADLTSSCSVDMSLPHKRAERQVGGEDRPQAGSNGSPGKAKPGGGGASDKIINQSSMKSAHDMYHNLNNLIVTSINWSILAYQKKPLVSFEYFQFLLKILLKEFALSTIFQSLFEGEYFLPG